MKEQVNNSYIKEFINVDETNLVNEYRKLRREAKTTQKRLSDETGLAQSTIARFEKNMHSASLTTFLKLLKPLGYTLVIKKKG